MHTKTQGHPDRDNGKNMETTGIVGVGDIGIILGLHRDNGKEHGNYNLGSRVLWYSPPVLDRMWLRACYIRSPCTPQSIYLRGTISLFASTGVFSDMSGLGLRGFSGRGALGTPETYWNEPSYRCSFWELNEKHIENLIKEARAHAFS